MHPKEKKKSLLQVGLEPETFETFRPTVQYFNQ